MGSTCKSIADSCQYMDCKVVSLQLIKINGKKKSEIPRITGKFDIGVQNEAGKG